LSITTNGNVRGSAGYGIRAEASHDVSITANRDVYGKYSGIFARSWDGAISITSAGKVTGATYDGISAYSENANVSISASGSVTGNRHGIYARLGYRYEDPPAGAVAITAAGLVQGTTGAGIMVKNYGAVGYGYSSSTSITVTSTGVVKGAVAGVVALSYPSYYTPGASAPITITNNGVIENLSGSPKDLAIRASSVYGDVNVVNNGTIIGTVDFRPASAQPTSYKPPDPSMINAGTWNTAGGTNYFSGSGFDTLTNAKGGVIMGAAAGATGPVTTTFDGLATFANAGLITMVNGVVGDRTVVNGNFVGQGGLLAVDTSLAGATSASDMMIVNGNASGVTYLLVYNAGGLGGLNTTGIPVVQVTGTAPEGAFQLGSPVQAGAYAYDLYRKEDGDPLFVLSNGIPMPVGPDLPNYRREVPVYLAMPELANFLAFGMIDNYDARMGGGRLDMGAAPPPGPIPCEKLTPAEAAKAIQTGRGCATPADQAKQLPTKKATEEEVRNRLMWARVFGVTGEQQPGAQPSLSWSTPMLNGK
jgi:autotransporter family porin